jgi:hypothetical protein
MQKYSDSVSPIWSQKRKSQFGKAVITFLHYNYIWKKCQNIRNENSKFILIKINIQLALQIDT